MEAVETQRLTSQSSVSQELPKPPGHATLGGAYKYQNKKGRIGGGYGCCKLITNTVSMIIFLFFAAGVITVWVAFRRAGMPQFMVQRLAIPKFDVHSNLKGDNAVLSTDMEFFLVADNKMNGIIGTSCGSMVMEVNWDEHKGHLVEEKVPFFTHNTGSSTVLKIQTHGEAKILNKHLEKDEMKLDLVLSGNVVFFWGPLKSKGYPFIVSCTDISTAASDSLCDAKLYSSSPPSRNPSPAPQSSPLSPNKDDGAAPGEFEAPPPTSASAPEGRGTHAGSPKPTQSPLLKAPSGLPVRLIVHDTDVVLDNGILQATIAKPGGFVTGIRYNGIENILGIQLLEDDRGYWDLVWAPPGTKGTKGKFERFASPRSFHPFPRIDDLGAVPFFQK